MGSNPTLRNLFWWLTWTTLQLFSETFIQFNWFLYLFWCTRFWLWAKLWSILYISWIYVDRFIRCFGVQCLFLSMFQKPFNPKKRSQPKQLSYRTIRTTRVIKEFNVLFCQCYFQVRRDIRPSKKSSAKNNFPTIHTFTWRTPKAEFNDPFNWEFQYKNVAEVVSPLLCLLCKTT